MKPRELKPPFPPSTAAMASCLYPAHRRSRLLGMKGEERSSLPLRPPSGKESSLQRELKPVIITPGEPAGIGPDIVLQLMCGHPDLPVVIMADQHLMSARAQKLGLKIPTGLEIRHIPLAVPCQPGEAESSQCRLCAGMLNSSHTRLFTGRISRTGDRARP